ncbi:hypothetical protein HHS34_009230 [Acidithiobacillus montserratensis]|uniref:Uncharacterized protein n=1 Tax=Acidithiobacillus montserratensis TaxID=2729135 RepID=A0ACD5HDL5_9PROT|nr:hypothetical protein [Acidithiobacillus montserratensis]MBU2749193.1 hypothetical protein [Acidithiobacillus montserratensis]
MQPNEIPSEVPFSPDYQPLHYENFRQAHFVQWRSAPSWGCCYCTTADPATFLGFIPREADQVLFLRVNPSRAFLYCRMTETDIEAAVQQHLGHWVWNAYHHQPWQSTLLDWAVASPAFLDILPWKPIPGGLPLWDETESPILVAQLAKPIWRDRMEPMWTLTKALAQWMDPEIRAFLQQEIPEAELAEYVYLWEAPAPAQRQERMQALRTQRSVVPRKPVDFDHL